MRERSAIGKLECRTNSDERRKKAENREDEDLIPFGCVRPAEWRAHVRLMPSRTIMRVGT